MPIKPILKTAMPHQAGEPRAHNFEEVNQGYTEAQARFEASRCLECQEASCEKGCPVQVPIREFIHHVAEGRFGEAYETITRTNSLPAVCGRVCPQESQCEKECHMATRFQPVGIGHLERFVADWFREQFSKTEGSLGADEPSSGGVRGSGPNPDGGSRRHLWSEGAVPRPDSVAGGPLERVSGPEGSLRKIAIVGSGPAGLSAAGNLARLGYRVTVFEALHEPGGVLRYGIPEFRLPKSVLDFEIDLLKSWGVEFVMNVVIGKTLTLDQLKNEMGFEAVFIGTGAGLPRFLGIPGEQWVGVFSSNEFLTRLNLMKAYRFPEYDTPLRPVGRVAVVGAGNTAMDAARSALRMGAAEVHVVYRRTEKEMTAREEEYLHAKEEGLQFHWLMNPVRVNGSAEAGVTGLVCEPQKLGAPDSSGRARPVPSGEPPVEIPVDTVVVAIGTSPNRLLTNSGGLKTAKWGGIEVEEATGETSKSLVFAGGDAVTGSATVILAAGAGRRAALAIHESLKK